MKKLVFSLISLLVLYVTCGAAGNLRRYFGQVTQSKSPIAFDKVISAHCSNGVSIMAVTGYSARFTRIVHVTPTQSYQRFVQIEVTPAGFSRSTSDDLFGTRVREDKYDGINYTSRLTAKTETGTSTTDLEADNESLAATMAAVQTCGLVNLLRSWAQPGISANLVDNSSDTYTFKVMGGNAEWLVTTDKTFLISRAQSKGVVYDFDDYHATGLNLPYTQKMSIGEVSVESHFTAIELTLDRSRVP